MREIPITKGKTLLVDDEDYELVSGFFWCASKGRHTYYAQSRPGPRGARQCILAHRLIMRAPADTEVDHINENGLDCRRANLRLATRKQNSVARHRDAGLKLRPNGRWGARVGQQWLGTFDTKDRARSARQAAVEQRWAPSY
jgi:hypothetical protein